MIKYKNDLLININNSIKHKIMFSSQSIVNNSLEEFQTTKDKNFNEWIDLSTENVYGKSEENIKSLKDEEMVDDNIKSLKDEEMVDDNIHTRELFNEEEKNKE